MDLNSLPAELVAGILKYNSYQTVLQIRKINSRLDSIATKYELGTRVPVKKVTLGHYVTVKWKNRKGKRKFRKRIIRGELSLKFDKDIWNYYNLPDYETLGYYLLNVSGNHSLIEMESMLEKVEIQESLYYYVTGVPFTDSNLDALIKQKQCFRKTTKLTFAALENEMVFSKDKMRHFLASCKRVNSFGCVARGGLEAICNSTVFGNNRWKKLHLHEQETNSVLDGVDRQFLFQIIKNCDEMRFRHDEGVKVAFTVMDVIDLLEICLKEKHFFTKQNWTLPALSLGKSTIAKVHERLINIEGITHSFSRDAGNNSLLGCRCKVKEKRDVEILFLIEGKNLNLWWRGEEGGVGVNAALFDDHDAIESDDSDGSDDD